jgi:hypothetical protein
MALGLTLTVGDMGNVQDKSSKSQTVIKSRRFRLSECGWKQELYNSVLVRKLTECQFLSAEIFLKMTVFWFLTPCSLVEIYKHFRGTCCLHHLHTHHHENFKSYLQIFVFEIGIVFSDSCKFVACCSVLSVLKWFLYVICY